MMLGRSLLTAAQVPVLAIVGAIAVSAQPAPSDEIRMLTRCTEDFDRCEDSIATAAQLAPQITRAFVGFCADHFEACEDRVIMIDRHNTLSARRRCLIGAREPAQLSETVRSILAWLAQHPETADRQTDESVTVAVAALWPCR